MKSRREVDEIAEKLASRSGIQPRAANGVKQPGRKGKVSIQSWHDPAVLQTLKIISAETGLTQQKLIADALNMLFKKHDKAAIA